MTALLLEKLFERRDLERDELQDVFARMVRGELDDAWLAAFLALLRAKGESPAEVAGAEAPGRARLAA